MPEHKVIIVGGGVIGACTALALCQRGHAVTLLDKGRFGRGASYGNAGLISPGHAPIPQPGTIARGLKWMLDPTSPLYIAPRLSPSMLRWMIHFARACKPAVFDRNMRVIASLSQQTALAFQTISDLGIEFDLRTHGYMDVYATEAGLTHAREHAQLVKALGIHDEIIPGTEVHKREPALREGLAGAAWHHDGAFADPFRFTTGVIEYASQHHALDCRPNAPVASIVTSDNNCIGVRLESGQVLTADRVVLCAGIHSDPLARTIGIRVPMQAAKGYHVHVAQSSPAMKTAAVLGETYVAVTPLGHEIRLAGTLELSGTNLNIRRRRLDMLTRGASKYIPAITQNTPVTDEWVGMRPCTADGLPVIGWSPTVKHLMIATGHAMMGFWLAPITARLVAQLMHNEQPSIDLTHLAPARF
ncbi:MAG: FAD-dependent oxidoreductase [Phycisphaerales bacterium]